jgi:CheY-like chemotaxis protein
MCSKQILLVEDDPGLRPLVERVLTADGYSVVAAADGLTALQAWERQGGTFPVAIIDLTLPGAISGRELAKRLTAAAPGLAIILTSGSDLNCEEVAAETPGSTFLQKPFRPSQLTTLVQQAMQRPRA